MSTLQMLTDDADTVETKSVGSALSLMDKISGQMVDLSSISADFGVGTVSNLLCSLKLKQMATGES